MESDLDFIVDQIKKLDDDDEETLDELVEEILTL
jgi:hypothetical protein